MSPLFSVEPFRVLPRHCHILLKFTLITLPVCVWDLADSGIATGMVAFLSVNKSKILCVNFFKKSAIKQRTLQNLKYKLGLKNRTVIQDNCDLCS